MTEYRVAVTLQRNLGQGEIQQLQASCSESTSSCQMQSPDVVLVKLDAPTSLAAAAAAEIQVQRSTPVSIKSIRTLSS